MFEYDIGVIGIGRVGLPLAISLSTKGFKTIGIDIDENIVKQVNQKIMPFKERGYDNLIKKTNLTATTELAKIEKTENIIITVGTPLLAHIETDLTQLNKVLIEIIKYLKENQNIILRSTVAPKTTLFVKRFIESKTKFIIGKNLFLSFCPERIAEGKALEELHTLPQIIGSSDKKSSKMAEKIFSKLSPKLLHTDFVSAELVKLFNNTYRYINFAIGNQFAIISEEFGTDVHEILKMSNYEYPRSNIALPGLTAGTCLRKDFGMINETSSYSDLLLNAWKINEFIPKFLVKIALQHTTIYDKKIGILGYTFKKDADDTRDSLVPKMTRYIEREVPKEIMIHEPNLQNKKIDKKFINRSLKEVLINAEIIFIAVNHSIFKLQFEEIYQKSKPGSYFIDIWNISGNNKIIFIKE